MPKKFSALCFRIIRSSAPFEARMALKTPLPANFRFPEFDTEFDACTQCKIANAHKCMLSHKYVQHRSQC